MRDGQYLQQFVDETATYNRILGSFFPTALWRTLPHFIQTWLRNYITSVVIYFLLCSLWCFYLYFWKHDVYIPKDSIPSRKSVISQINVSMTAMPWVSTIPTISEYMIEKGWTKCYATIGEVGPFTYLIHMFIYVTFVEFSLYWTHRAMHDIKPLYKYIHVVHHKFNKENSLSPFAGPASHPVEAVLDVMPYFVLHFLVPMHFTTELFLLSLNGVWTLNTHSCLRREIWPIMSANYHTMHHITYRYNYGNYTILMDWIFGTLRRPWSDNGKSK